MAMKSNPPTYAISFASQNGESVKLGLKLSSWFTARGRPSMAINISGGGEVIGMRSASKLMRHLGKMDDGALRGYLKLGEGDAYALTAHANEITFDAIERLSKIFAPIVFCQSLASPTFFIEGVSGIPLVYVIGSCAAFELDAARQAGDAVRSARSSVSPAAFLTLGFDEGLAPKAARIIGAAWWGDALSLDAVASRAMEASSCVKIDRQDLGIVSPEKIALREDCANKAKSDTAILGPLSRVMEEEGVSEIMVNAFDEVFVEKNGKIEKSAVRFRDDEQLRCLIERIASLAGRRIDESNPMVDARLSDGSRVNAVIPPLSVDHPVLTVRRFIKRLNSMEELVASQMLSTQARDYLADCVREKASVLISGGTGSGKTTLLNVLASCICGDERIVTVEDAAELSLSARHVVRLEARCANVEGKGEITIRDLVRNALRMRPDRIVVGECRGAEALDMLQAMNTGHEGSLTTVHANSPRDALMRLETMALFSGAPLPISVVREQIARAVKVVVQIVRSKDGRRRVVEIAEVTGMESGVICMQTVMRINDSNAELGFTGLSQKFGRPSHLAVTGV